MSSTAWDRLPPIERLGGDDGRHVPEDLAGTALAELDVRALTRPKPITAYCSTSYKAIRSSGTRRLSAIELLVVHSTEGDTARGAAAWFANPRCQGSAHLVVDAIECYRTLPPSAIPWAAPGANGRGWHLEIAGRAGWSRAEWLRHRGAIERAAYKLAWHARAFRIPLTRLTVADLRAGVKRGVVDHDQCSKAYGGTHWDVGDGFPFDLFMTRARAYRAGL